MFDMPVSESVFVAGNFFSLPWFLPTFNMVLADTTAVVINYIVFLVVSNFPYFVINYEEETSN